MSLWAVDDEAQSSDESVLKHLTVHSDNLLSILYFLVLPVCLTIILVKVFFADLLSDELVSVVVDSHTVVRLCGLIDIIEDFDANLADLEL